MDAETAAALDAGSPQALTYIKIYGLPRSGTNWLSWLVQANFDHVDVLQQTLGDKHGFPPPTLDERAWKGPHTPDDAHRRWDDLDDPQSIRDAVASRSIVLACIVKRPVAWFCSAWKYWYARKVPAGSPWRDPAELARIWSRTLASYEECRDQGEWPTVILRHEDLLASRDHLRALSDLGLVRTPGPWVTTDRYMRRGGDGWYPARLESDEAFHRAGPRCPAAALQTFLDELDVSVCERYGYPDPRR